MGRPREFDPEAALDSAMRLFWEKGYYDTSVRDLVDRTGVNYYGLYGAFENKHGLFLAALDRYRQTVTREILEQLSGPGTARERIRRAFACLLDFALSDGEAIGCLMANTAVELVPHDRDAAKRFEGHMTALTQAFETALTEATRSGDLASGRSPSALAQFFATTAYSIGLLARAGRGRDEVERYIETAMSLLD